MRRNKTEKIETKEIGRRLNWENINQNQRNIKAKEKSGDEINKGKPSNPGKPDGNPTFCSEKIRLLISDLIFFYH